MFLSIPVMWSILDRFSLSDLGAMKIFALVASGISVFISAIMAAMHYIGFLRKFVGGTIFELVIAIILLGLWIGAAVVIQDPENDIASTISTERVKGVEYVKEANLYIFTWFALFCNVYLVGSFFRDYKRVDLRVLSWVSLLAASLILLGISIHLKDNICDADSGTICIRIQYTMVSSVVVGVISLFASVLSYASKLSPRLGLTLISPTAVIFSFGVALLTSANGPGHEFGTIYFTVWFGSIVSILVLIGEFNEMFLYDEEMNETDVLKSQKAIEIPLGGNKYGTISTGEKNPYSSDTIKHGSETDNSSEGIISVGESLTFDDGAVEVVSVKVHKP